MRIAAIKTGVRKAFCYLPAKDEILMLAGVTAIILQRQKEVFDQKRAFNAFRGFMMTPWTSFITAENFHTLV
ncbi:hypothetical protein [Arsenicibacter rosenii]|uniref:Uncharacterized protein n=1 Tax=Arsenicibacter rosenii TaxID=1750698 RepID=A0A1S2VEI8_9BACT|nr:hypothetical protein [Arsenicibacter rosenii]OIN56830.1 hypothetical protein BLX24_22930 [Arsenicibacter rosenii]